MNDLEYRQLIDRALGMVVDGLLPTVNSVLAPHIGEGENWTVVLQRHDQAHAGSRHSGQRYGERDFSLLVRVLTHSIDPLGRPFERAISPLAGGCLRHLRQVRNDWAHNEQFDRAKTNRAILAAQTLLQEVAMDHMAEELGEVRLRILAEADSATVERSTAAQDEVPAANEPAPGGVGENGRSVVEIGATTTGALAATTTPDSEPASPEDTPDSADPIRVDAPALTIEIDAHDELSYAMANARIQPVTRILVRNSGEELRGASLDLEVVDANGSLGGPRTIRLDLAAGQDKPLENVSLTLDPGRMLAVEQRRPGSIRATLRTADGDRLAEASIDVTVLAASEWKARPLQLGLELLSSFVQPNAAVVGAVLRDAAERLGAATGRSDLDGYQSQSEERVDSIVEAVWDSIRSRGIAYTEPPASWGEDGQKVRTPADVLDGRLGTCLDLTLTLAAALEQAGINSTLWLLPGHIFLGYWRVESTLGTAGSLDASTAVNYADMDRIRVVETTMLTGDSRTIAQAQQTARSYLATGSAGLLGVADVREARNSGLYPLPSRSVDARGAVTVHEYTPAGSEFVFDFGGENRGRRREVATGPARVATWKNALLDLSLRNRLINYTNRAGFSLAVPGADLARFEDIVNRAAPVQLVASDDIPEIERERGIRYGREMPEQSRTEMLFGKKRVFVDVTTATYTDKLRKFAASAKTIVEETGANNLYLAFGTLVWTLDHRELRSPMVLVPVTIKETSRGSVFTITLDESGSSTPNFCLIEKLRVSLGLDLPGLAAPAEDESGIDLRVAFDSVRATLAERGLPFRVEETVDLAVLQFAKYRLWKDLDEQWETLAKSPLVSHLINSPLEPFEDPAGEDLTLDLDALAAAVPVPADASQLEAVAAAVAGKTFVLEGPPGTGKSQTITNLLARALAEGKRVLFVAEKRAALDVVKRRLEEVGLGPFCLDLHDKGARPAEARAQIRAALDFSVRPDKQGFESKQLVVESTARGLRKYADRVHDENGAGFSLYEARQREVLAEEHVRPLEVPLPLVENGTSEQFDRIRQALRFLSDASDAARPRRGHPWSFVSPTRLAPGLAEQLAPASDELDAALADLDRLGFPTAGLSSASDPAVLAPAIRLTEAELRPASVLDQFVDPGWDAHFASTQDELLRLAPTHFDVLDTVREAVLDGDLFGLRASAVAANEAGLLSRKRLRRGVRDWLTPYLRVDPESVPLDGLVPLIDRLLEAHRYAEHLRGRVQQIPAPLAPAGWSPFDGDALRAIADEIEVLRRLRRLVVDGEGANDVVDRDLLRQVYRRSDRVELGAALLRFGDAYRAVLSLAGAPSTELNEWADGLPVLERWRASAVERGTGRTAVRSLQAWLTLLEQLEPLRAALMTTARKHYLEGTEPADEALLAFEKGLASASVAERLAGTELDSFETSAHERLLGRYTTGASAVRDELPRIIPAQVLARRDLSSVPTSMMGGLKRQLEYKLRGMKVRKLMEEFGPLITQIAPCTLMSPESVARFLPVDSDLYDIVVFDEASQVRVADAVGALGRARSAVIVGDSKQMPPTSFAETGAADDEAAAAETVVDEESILSEASQARVPSRWLSWHYRSQDERLIAFSNSRYYDSRLSSFPTPHDGDTGAGHDGYGISFVRVAGSFIRTGRGKALRTNPAEAEAIVAEVHRRFEASPEEIPSLGIITFNAQQRDLIDGMLRGSTDARVAQSLDVSDGLFVKNLENVQGDERDAILFSVAFSANDKGVVPLQFGPLTRAGGERRWNVAVTRARRQVVLYCSFDPAELRADETQSVGVKHLKAYLQIAQAGFGAADGSLDRASLPDAHRDELAGALIEAGLSARADIGLSEFRVDVALSTVEEPDRPLVAVLLDGPSWRRRRTVSDRDGLPESVLKNAMGWPAVERVWLPEWLADRDAVITRLRAAVDRAEAEVRERRELEAARVAAAVPAPVAPPLELAPDDEAAEREDDVLLVRSTSSLYLPPTVERFPSRDTERSLVQYTGLPLIDGAAGSSAVDRTTGEIGYTSWPARTVGTLELLNALPSPEPTRLIADLVVQIVEAEGPIHEMRAAKLVAGAFGLLKVHGARSDSILRCFPEELRRADDPGFLWAAGQEPHSHRTARLRAYVAVDRIYEHIDPFEAINAVALCVRSAPGIDHLALVRATMSFLGIQRMTDNIRALVEETTAAAVAAGRITQTGLGTYLPS
ncbi:DUF3320 domain-containing protein [Rathayibacter sp. Leaf296]|uniref:DUF3320 domain-containing protein n=1 Tax=Rathayibacter sp. Leaf296 TaxID=1736327 RepID=UPI000702F3E9|nr:DUF3320 domain-containing protein [Rathayibacter sp. Leaf296]KQQ09743.1 hypothetical protein ASF46_01040 [Rathayibacter sp. Leaf296]